MQGSKLITCIAKTTQEVHNILPPASETRSAASTAQLSPLLSKAGLLKSKSVV